MALTLLKFLKKEKAGTRFALARMSLFLLPYWQLYCKEAQMDDAQATRFALEANECDRVLRLLDNLVDLEHADAISPSRENAVFKASVVLWALICQRISDDTSMEAAVKLLLRSNPSLLPKNKRVEEKHLSDNTGGYSRARSRMKLEVAEWLAETVSNSLVQFSPSTFEGQRVFALDGTCISLAPEPKLRKLYPPASESGVWPIALLVVAHELSSGAALMPQIGAMYGQEAISETALIDKALAQIPNGSLIMADSNFGIFAVAHEIARAGKNFVLRLTAQRFNSMQKKARLIDEGTNYKTWKYTWKPSFKDRAGRPHIHQKTTLQVWLHEIVVHPELTVYLVTDQDYHAETFADLYLQRGTVEIDIRNVKVVLDTQNINARSDDTFKKELYASIVAYNLIVQLRRQAASAADLPPRRLSFKRVCTTFKVVLMAQVFTSGEAWVTAYEKALRIAQKQKLPNRPGRHYEREVYSRSPNAHNFKKRTPKRIQEQESG